MPHSYSFPGSSGVVEEQKTVDLPPLCAWVTYANNTEYIYAACVLAHSLKRVGTKYPLVIMVPEDTETPEIKDDAIRFVRLPPLDICNPKGGASLARPRYYHCINKIFLWCLEEYEKVCWLDSDMVVVESIDDLFDVPIPQGGIAAAPGCTCNAMNHPRLETKPHCCPFRDPTKVYANAGLLLLEPNKEVHERLRYLDYDRPLCEQDAFNDFFRGRIHTLPCSYNFMHHLPIAHPEVKDTKVKIFHYVFGKPWVSNLLPELHENYYTLWTELSNEQAFMPTPVEVLV